MAGVMPRAPIRGGGRGLRLRDVARFNRLQGSTPASDPWRCLGSPPGPRGADDVRPSPVPSVNPRRALNNGLSRMMFHVKRESPARPWRSAARIGVWMIPVRVWTRPVDIVVDRTSGGTPHPSLWLWITRPLLVTLGLNLARRWIGASSTKRDYEWKRQSIRGQLQMPVDIIPIFAAQNVRFGPPWRLRPPQRALMCSPHSPKAPTR